MIDIEKEMKNTMNLSEEEFCKYLDSGSTKSMAWWIGLFNNRPVENETLTYRFSPKKLPVRKPPFKF